jgi:peptide/nickel transport system substrate-binding protein
MYPMSLFTKRTSLGLLDRYFAFIERRSPFDALVFHVAVGFFLLTLLIALISINTSYITSIPTSGGTLVEGIVGTPRFVNPVLAITRADQDMVQLIFSGLFKLNETGELVPDVADTLEISPDGRTYTITLKRGIRFHNGTELTTRDVAYTISLIQNPDLKSPLRGNWDRVVVEVLDDHTLTLTLDEAYIPFKENLTFGILPRELWSELPIEQIPFSQNNTEPIGTGPYQVSNVLRTSSGLISAYELSSFSGGGTSAPNIGTLVFNFYQNEEQLLTALQNKVIGSSPSVSSAALSTINTDNYRIIKAPLPRTFGVYFNQNRSIALRDTAARRALSEAINRTELVNTVLDGSGIPTTSPVPPGFLDVELPVLEQEESESDGATPLDRAKSILTNGGWTQSDSGTWTKTINDEEVTLSFTLVTANTETFTRDCQLPHYYLEKSRCRR